jgi:hypothetical protein
MNNEMMIHQLVQQEDTFDANVQEHLSILIHLQKMHSAEQKKDPWGGGSKLGR